MIVFSEIEKIIGNLFSINFKIGSIQFFPRNTYVEYKDNKTLHSNNTLIVKDQISQGINENKKSYLLDLSNPYKKKETIEKVSLPFSTGLYVKINRKEWWADKNHITFGLIKLIPAYIEEEIIITEIKIKNRDSFIVLIDKEGKLKIKFWSHENNFISLKVANTFRSLPNGDNHLWKLTKFKADSRIISNEGDSLAISFDETIVNYSLQIERKRKRSNRIEKYLVIIPNE